jgi:hypothetical protein
MNIYKRTMYALALTGLTAACLITFMAASAERPVRINHEAAAGKPNYTFKNKISREVLENYLDRSITMQRMLTGEGNFEDNLRMIGNMKAKLVGRAVCQWGEEARLMENFAKEKELAARVHAQDPEIILQACIFEIVTPQIDQIAVPDWAFEGLGMPVEKRNFRYADMLYPDGRYKGQWGSGAREGSVPDVSRPETRLMFYFLAASYINAGIEAIHFGQVELMNKNDRNLDHYAQILGLIRQYAAKHARRGMVICDSHVPGGGFVKDGKLLMDVHSFPLRIKETPGREGEEKAILEVGHTDALFNRSKGGIAPSGWKCEHLPYLVEFDNFGSTSTPGKPTGGIWVYGYDEISWFAKQSDEYRRAFLRYAYDWLARTDPNGFLEMPGSRQTAKLVGKRWYDVNNKSQGVPNGSGDEDTIRDIWANGRTSKR